MAWGTEFMTDGVIVLCVPRANQHGGKKMGCLFYSQRSCWAPSIVVLTLALSPCSSVSFALIPSSALPLSSIRTQANFKAFDLWRSCWRRPMSCEEFCFHGDGVKRQRLFFSVWVPGPVCFPSPPSRDQFSLRSTLLFHLPGRQPPSDRPAWGEGLIWLEPHLLYFYFQKIRGFDVYTI